MFLIASKLEKSRPVSRILSRPPAGGQGRSSIWDRHCCLPQCPSTSSGHMRPTRDHNGRATHFPVWSCSAWGLAHRQSPGCRVGALTSQFQLCHPSFRLEFGRVISVPLSFGLPRLDVIQHAALWSPDFPPSTFKKVLGNRPACSFQGAIKIISKAND